MRASNVIAPVSSASLLPSKEKLKRATPTDVYRDQEDGYLIVRLIGTARNDVGRNFKHSEGHDPNSRRSHEYDFTSFLYFPYIGYSIFFSFFFYALKIKNPTGRCILN